MRRSAKLATAGIALVLVVVACGGDDDDGTANPRPGEGGETITPEYCNRYCNAQAQQGALQSRAACLTDCCKNVAGGCPAIDAGTSSPVDAGSSDAGGCAIPCGSACCNAGEGCSFAGPTPACVKTCRTASDCTGGCCAPATNAAGDPVGPYVCKQGNGGAYGCCGVGGGCSGAYCCIGDTNGNHFCGKKCELNGFCGAATCQGYSFDTFYTTCSGPTACGPSPL
jgi:hypothetical protein